MKARPQGSASPLAVTVFALVLPACGGSPGAALPEAGTDKGPEFDAFRAADEDAPPASDAAPPDAGACPPAAGDERTVPLVTYGTGGPGYLPLDSKRIRAIASLSTQSWWCTAIVVGDTWALTAKHCTFDEPITSMRLGLLPVAPGEGPSQVEIARVIEHPEADLAILELSSSVSGPDLEPMGVFQGSFDASWLGTFAEFGGYGRDEDGRITGDLRFLGGTLLSLESSDRQLLPNLHIVQDIVVFDGEGKRSTCPGDSGGPLMVFDTDGVTRVAGLTSRRSHTHCAGRTDFVRLDRTRDWVASQMGTTLAALAGPASCGALDPAGRCIRGMAVFCEGGAVRADTCDQACGFDPARGGYRCLAPGVVDPCDGADGVGRCEDHTAVWCEQGAPKARHCAPCSEACGLVPEAGGFGCYDDPCHGIDGTGACVDDQLLMCTDGTLDATDCTTLGRLCVWDAEAIQHTCR